MVVVVITVAIVVLPLLIAITVHEPGLVGTAIFVILEFLVFVLVMHAVIPALFEILVVLISAVVPAIAIMVVAILGERSG